ncbi:prolyl oligopeptidase family serine peptidase [Roseateles sp. YR242]|uniref:prolyl oligopeptidase family serine peptidase n=1 Tax=Roseateles sp. YR242 TaxID=1855305 RepID=UPI0015A60BE9|nr:prolyl oligopeptidase family serine peptidase [Roseateles sp. YR242]
MITSLKTHRRDWLRLSGGLLAALHPLLAAAELARPGVHMVLDGIPPFEKTPLAEAHDSATLRFLGWHPQRAEMLVLMRHGASQQLHLVRAPGAAPEPLTSGRDAVTSGAWEPARGDCLVFSRDPGGSEAYRLYRLGVAGQLEGPPVPLTPAGERISEWVWLPQGRGLVCLQERLDKRPPSAEEPIEDRDEGSGGSEANEATPLPVDGAASTPPTPDSGALSRIWWMDPQRPDERQLLAQSARGRYTGLRISQAGSILATLTLDGRSTPVRFASGASATGASTTVAVASARDLAWHRQAVVGEFRHLVRQDLSGGSRRNELTEIGADLEALAEPPPGSDCPLALVYNVDGVSELRLYRDGTSQPPAAVAAGLTPGVIRNPRWHPVLPLLGFDQISADSPGRLFALSLEDGKARPWSSAAGEASALRTQVLRWTSFDGLAISGLHIAPPARFEGPRPVFISLHGGPSSQSRPGYLAGVMRAYVERLGMHLIMPNVRGSDGFGKSFLTLDNGRLREHSVRDVSALLDLIAKLPDMDAGRVVVAGGSYGGYLSLAVATHESARIAGSICRVGIANFVSFLENTESYRRDNRRMEYGDERDPGMRSFLTSISPLTHADAVKKPLMVVHGRNDPRVPFGEAQAMVAAVRAQGTPVWFLSASDEGHSFTKADNRAYLNQASFEFVRRLVTAA